MRCMIEMESAVRGLLWVNGQFCGPVDREGQTFPASENAEIFIQFFPLDIKTKPAALEMVLQNGSIARLEPETVGYALLWADGVIQLEIRPETDEQPDEQAQGTGGADCAAALSFHAAGGRCGCGGAAHGAACGGQTARNMMRLFRSDLRR